MIVQGQFKAFAMVEHLDIRWVKPETIEVERKSQRATSHGDGWVWSRLTQKGKVKCCGQCQFRFNYELDSFISSSICGFNTEHSDIY